MDENSVTFRVKDNKKGGEWKELTLDGVEFVRRFLMHVSPGRFVRIRHYGLLSKQKKRGLILLCRNLIGCREFMRRFRKDDKVRAIRILYKIDVTKCPKYGETMSYEPACSAYTGTTVPGYIQNLFGIDTVHLGERRKYGLSRINTGNGTGKNNY